MRTISAAAAMPSIKRFSQHALLVGIALLFLVINIPAWAGDLLNTPPRRFLLYSERLPGDEWYTYRYNVLRTGTQPYASALSDPSNFSTLSVRWSFPATGPAIAFKASPIVVDDTVFIGSLDGTFYALDAATGKLKWKYPPSGKRLLGADAVWSRGFESSASFWARPPNGAVIFGAQDRFLGPFNHEGNAYGSARLFALDARTGKLIWLSEPVATIDGDTIAPDRFVPPSPQSLKELHQKITWSASLIFNNKAYIGIHDTTDNPIQTGRVIAVDLATGRKDDSFQFRAVGTRASPTTVRGGGVWNAPATDGTGVYFTTGNTRIPYCSYPYSSAANPSPIWCPAPSEPEPVPNHGLSMIRVNKDTGKIVWKFQPVPFDEDGDPDWAAGAAVMLTSCGELIASVQKDGWSYAHEADPSRIYVSIHGIHASLRWQFPTTGFGGAFLSAVHGDDDYRRPGAAWNDVFIVRTGGETVATPDHISTGYDKLHALNACATSDEGRVRWIADIPNKMDKWGHTSYSAPTVTGGIVFIGTNENPMDHRGHLVVLGDPKVVPPVGWRCSNTELHLAPICDWFGYTLVPIPKVLADIPMPDGGSLAAMRNEPVLARGRVFVATHPSCAANEPDCRFPNAGHVYMLAP